MLGVRSDHAYGALAPFGDGLSAPGDLGGMDVLIGWFHWILWLEESRLVNHRENGDEFMWRFPKSWRYPQASISNDGISHCKPPSYWGSPIYGNIHVTSLEFNNFLHVCRLCK